MTTIIIPHYNRLSLLKETIASVEAQTSGDWEIIIADDHSDDEVWSELQSLANDKIRIYQREGNKTKGPSACRNLGTRMAKGQYLLFLDSDDLLAPFCLEQRERAMKENPVVDAGVFLMSEFSEHPGDKETIFNNRVPEEEWVSAFLTINNPWQTMAPIWRKEAFEKAGGFNEEFLYMEDPELHLRSMYKGIHFKTFYEQPADCFYRTHHIDETKSNFYYNSILYRVKYYNLIFDTYPDSFVRKYAVDIKAGINGCIRTFLYSRKNQFPELYRSMMQMMQRSGIFSEKELRRYKRLIEWGNTENPVLKKLKIKGLCYKLLG
ncbi:MAG: glycosyltransferase family 2 protein [Chitinophagaceae bacterium]|nr:glycosyltransferase family 2 protein [Chitinophagaceae bacterium]